MSTDKTKKFPRLLSTKLVIGLVLLGCLTLWGCKFSDGKVAKEGVEHSQNGYLDKFSQSSDTIQHAMGTTPIQGTPERVVTLTNEATDSVLALGVQPIGAIKSWSGNPYYDYIEDDLVGVPVVGDQYQPNLEKIATLKPDLILGSKVRHEQVYAQLSTIAPTVFSETYGLTWKQNLRLYAQALNKEARGEQVLANWHQRLADFQSKMGDRLNTKVSLVRFMPGKARIYYHDSFPGQILVEAGLQRPDTQDKAGNHSEVSLEQIGQLDGDIILYFTAEKSDGDATELEKVWLNHPLWQTLKAVQKNQVYQVSDVHWNAAQGVQAANLALDDLYKHLLKN